MPKSLNKSYCFFISANWLIQNGHQ
jgi:hypothetical protein